jgi:nucleoside-diphosphate-sugar epimerase
VEILLTGAAGFTGVVFKQQAEASGHIVWSLAANLLDKAAVAAEVAVLRPTAVVHLAGISAIGHRDELAYYGVHVLGTIHLLEALATLPVAPTKVLLASSANVYGNCLESPIVEEQPPAPVNIYSTSKLSMEHMARTFDDRLPLVIARPFNYTGHGQTTRFLIPKLISHFAHKEATIQLGNVQVEREFNDVRMVCAAYLGLLEKGQPGEVYNVCSGQPYALNDVLEMLQSLSGHKIAVEVNPDFVRASEVHRLCGNPTKLFETLGTLGQWSLEDTLRRMLDSYDR